MQFGYQKRWEFLKNKFESGQLSHAYLFSGQNAEQIKLLAKEFVKLINCQSYNSDGRQICKTDEKTEVCQNCRMIEKENFPDLLVVKSENSKSSLKDELDKGGIDILQIREINNFLSFKPYYDSFKAVLVENAERMNTRAQSCLLKTLEEPKGKTLIILVSRNPEILLPTIISRCQTVKFFSSAQAEFSEDENKILQNFLGVANLSLAEKFSYAKTARLDNGNFEKILTVARKYFRNTLLAKTGVIENKNGFDDERAGNLTILKIKKILNFIEDISQKSLTYNINPKLSLEILLMEL